MPRGVSLSEYEKGAIDKLNDIGVSITDIAKNLSRSQTVISNYIRLGSDYGINNSKRGRKSIFTIRDKRKIVNLAVIDKKSIRDIKKQNYPNVSRSAINNILSNNKDIIYKKFKKLPPLTAQHKQARVAFGLEHIRWSSDWHNVVFSDEKRFNLDGPDGYRYYWHDLRNEEKIFSRRQNGNYFILFNLYN